MIVAVVMVAVVVIVEEEDWREMSRNPRDKSPTNVDQWSQRIEWVIFQPCSSSSRAR